MPLPEGKVHALSAALVDALLKQGFVRPMADPAVLQRRIIEVLAENLEQDRQLEEEAERLAQAHARQMVGMDQRKIIQGIKERLARERGFAL
jgi:hypothetical protein